MEESSHILVNNHSVIIFKQMTIILFISLLAVLSGCAATANEVLITVSNPTDIDRNNEIVELEWQSIQEKLNLQEGESFIITANNIQTPYQLVTNSYTNSEKIIFLSSVEANKDVVYTISNGIPEPFKPLVYGRFVPERKDDFAWENNRTAFRIYGPALKATGEISNGMDYWAKKTEELIIDKWYKNDLSNVASYHTDNGEGLDFYKVGRTLGLGMTAPYVNDTICLGDNFVNAEIIDNGPLRITFKLTYDPYFAGEFEVYETRIISLDAFSFFNRVTNIFKTDASNFTVATGIVMPVDNPEEDVDNKTFGDKIGIIAYETPTDKVNGTIYTAAINPSGFNSITISEGHFLGLNSYESGKEYTYYAGGGWSKAAIKDFDSWIEFIKTQKEIIDNPLIVKIK